MLTRCWRWRRHRRCHITYVAGILAPANWVAEMLIENGPKLSKTLAQLWKPSLEHPIGCRQKESSFIFMLSVSRIYAMTITSFYLLYDFFFNFPKVFRKKFNNIKCDAKHCPQPTVQCTLYTVHCTLYTVLSGHAGLWALHYGEFSRFFGIKLILKS